MARSSIEIFNSLFGPDTAVYQTVLASAARTATTTSSTITAYGRGLKLYINVTAITDTPSVVFKVQDIDPLSSAVKSTAVITSAAITATGLTVLTIYPGLTPAANTVVSDVVPRNFNVVATHADADSITYSVSAVPIY